ncbi:hypothetical protein [Thermococcus barophilus]|uniref:Uncharacterized protein n=1 Tax=Thermococcus barophilus TaxID=55802 RepID=A0A0S1XAZ2_THEBA|nr:hypothetical protein [Thermococcus barophilus]ALM74916.1 conserved exported hypothetical protein [Thermococcus barophilus]
MRKKILGVGLLALVVGLVFGAAAAYQGIPENATQGTGDCMCGSYIQARYMHGQKAGHGRGTPQFMGLGIKGQYLGEANVDEQQIQEYLSGVTIEGFTTPRGITVQKLVLDGEYIGKIVGDYDLSSLEVYKAYETQNGIKVFLSYDGDIVGFFLMK